MLSKQGTNHNLYNLQNHKLHIHIFIIREDCLCVRLFICMYIYRWICMGRPHSRPNRWTNFDQIWHVGSLTMTMPKKKQERIAECAGSHLCACEITRSCDQYFIGKMALTQVDILHRCAQEMPEATCNSRI